MATAPVQYEFSVKSYELGNNLSIFFYGKTENDVLMRTMQKYF